MSGYKERNGRKEEKSEITWTNCMTDSSELIFRKHVRESGREGILSRCLAYSNECSLCDDEEEEIGEEREDSRKGNSGMEGKRG